MTEIANLIVLCGANDPVNIVFNFTAVAIIAEFDNYIFESMKNESFKELLEDEFVGKVLVIEHTTSKKCHHDEKSVVKDLDGNLRLLKVPFSERDLINKIQFVIYKVLKCFFVGFYFYFIPFSVIFISTIIPILYRVKPIY
jgi:hypothetical protein